MSSFNKENNAYFLAKASLRVNWLWYKRLSHLNFKNINNLAKYNLVSRLPSLAFSKDKNYLAYEKRKHHRASFKTKRSFSINKSLHLLHMDLFGPVKPQTISHNKYNLVILDEYSRKMENLKEVRVKELGSDNGTLFGNHKLEEFCDEKVAKAFRVFNIRRKEIEEIVHVTFSEDDEAISQTSTEGDAINFNENRSFPNDEFIKPRTKDTQCSVNIEYFPYVFSYEKTTSSVMPTLQNSVTSKDLFEFTIADDLAAIHEPDHAESVDILESAEPQDNVLSESTSDDQPASVISPSAKVILQNPAPQDRWSREKHIKLVNIIGEPLAGITTRSKIRDSDQEGIDYKETFAPVARLEAIRIFLAYTTYMGFVEYQMDVKSAFMNGKLFEEVYIQQPPRFESSEFPDHVCKLDKALYGLKQAPRAWYETLSTFLTQHKFVRGISDNTLFTYKTKSDVIIVQIYVDDIIFGSTSVKLSKQFAKLMTKKYEMSMMGELTYFLGFQIKQDSKGISICQEKSVKDLLKKYDLADCALVKCPMLPPTNLGPDDSRVFVNETLFRGMIGSLMYLTASKPDIQFSICLCASLWYPKGLGFDLKAYSDSDYTGCKLDRKSTSSGCWISIAMSSAEAEYVVAAGCCAQVLWIKSQLADYDVLYDKVPIFCDNTSAIAISNNPVLHSRTKHIDIRYHFIRDHILKGDIELHFVPTELQLADI
ncbi:retrovirus-related pol polyprotein from transposon TNT 1-94, partial [Tanacetum coccineum]